MTHPTRTLSPEEGTAMTALTLFDVPALPEPGTPWPNPTGPWSPDPAKVEADRLVRALARDGIIKVVQP